MRRNECERLGCWLWAGWDGICVVALNSSRSSLSVGRFGLLACEARANGSLCFVLALDRVDTKRTASRTGAVRAPGRDEGSQARWRDWQAWQGQSMTRPWSVWHGMVGRPGKGKQWEASGKPVREVGTTEQNRASTRAKPVRQRATPVCPRQANQPLRPATPAYKGSNHRRREKDESST